jgi:TRAP-type C4-dicarboxylate transport system permease small subunit
MKKTLKFIDNSLALVENSLIVLIVAIMVVMSFLQVFLRNFFDYGILWGDIFLRHMVLWVGFIGASLATRDERHINIDVLGRISPEKFRPYLRTVVDLFTMLVCIALAHAAYGFLQYEIEANTILFNNIPAWIFRLDFSDNYPRRIRADRFSLFPENFGKNFRSSFCRTDNQIDSRKWVTAACRNRLR